MMRQFVGKGVSTGIAMGPMHFYSQGEVKIDFTPSTDIACELKRFEEAVTKAVAQLQSLYEKALAEIGEEAALLFEVHQMMLEGEDFTLSVKELIENENQRAEFAVQNTSKELSSIFSSMDDAYMKARAADIEDISNRVINILCGVESQGLETDTPVILIAEDLTPSQTVQLDRSKILGFVTFDGSANSHTAILARTIGIPAIIGMDRALLTATNNEITQIFIDGYTGELIINPDKVKTQYLEAKIASETAKRAQMEALKGQANKTLDGKEVMVYCNIGGSADVDSVLSNDGGGIGLFRSEFLYLQSNDYPSEEVQFQQYRTVVEQMCGKRVIIRTLDIGADKQADYFHLDAEENPAMGLRAIRICLSRPEVFRTQLRALYRASAYGKVAIMFPMITSVWEIQEVKRICRAVREDLEAEGVPMAEYVELGIMIETPAAVMMSDRLAWEVDFFSVGTNDLTQYTLAVDRQCKHLDRFFDAHHPAVLRMIDMATQNAHRAGIWLGICGELAADTNLTETFLAMGVDELSVSPSSVLPLRSVIRGINTTANSRQILNEMHEG